MSMIPLIEDWAALLVPGLLDGWILWLGSAGGVALMYRLIVTWPKSGRPGMRRIGLLERVRRAPEADQKSIRDWLNDRLKEKI